MASVRTIHVKLIDFGCAQKVSKLGAVVQARSVLEFTGKWGTELLVMTKRRVTCESFHVLKSFIIFN